MLNYLMKMLKMFDTYVSNPSLEKDLHEVGCKTETIDVCGCKLVMIKFPEGFDNRSGGEQ